MTTLTNDELIKLRSRVYRGYRAPVATTQFFAKELLVSVSRDVSDNVTQTVHRYSGEDGMTVTRTTDYTLDVDGNITGSVDTYTYETSNPTPN